MVGHSQPTGSAGSDARKQILAHALRLFANRGFDATSLQDIADEVGIRKQSLLYHFESKEQLRRGVLDEMLLRWNEGLPRLLVAAARTGLPRFGSVIHELIAFFAEDPDRARLLLRESLDRPADMRKLLASHVSPWVSLVADYIREGQKNGDIDFTVDPEAYVIQVVNMVVSGMATAASLDHALLPQRHALGDPDERHQRELIRIARASLFRERLVSSPRSEQRPARSPTRKAGSEPSASIRQNRRPKTQRCKSQKDGKPRGFAASSPHRTGVAKPVDSADSQHWPRRRKSS
jgi:AcrR family transcriptional regulator